MSGAWLGGWLLESWLAWPVAGGEGLGLHVLNKLSDYGIYYISTILSPITKRCPITKHSHQNHKEQ